MVDDAVNTLAKCVSQNDNLKVFGFFAFVAMLVQVIALIWMLATKRTKGDEEFWETVGETIERGFWMLAFLVIWLSGAKYGKFLNALIALSIAASAARGAYALFTVAK